MSHYTTEVRFICEQYAGEFTSSDYSTVESIIENSRKKIFDFDFPIYDESYRSVLETKILKRYYTREIGFETVALWKFWLNKRLNEIMPYYNQLYKSTLLEFNPFYDVDYTTTNNANKKYDEKNSKTNNSNGNSLRTDNLKTSTSGTDNSTRTDNLKTVSSGTNKNTRTDNLHTATENTEDATNNNTRYDLYSDTPQGALTGVNEENYLTNARKTTDNRTDHRSNSGTTTNTGTQTIDSSNNEETDYTGTQKNDSTNSQETNYTGTQGNEVTNASNENGTRNFTDTSDYLEHVAGKRNGASFSAMLNEYRNTFINIDVMIINELADLFMNVW